MNVNPYETPSEPERTEQGERPTTVTPVEQRPWLRALRAFLMIVGVGTGSLLGMAFMVVLGDKFLRGNFSLVDPIISVVLIGGTAGALITLAGILLLRAWDKAALRRVNNRQAENEEQ